MYRPSLLDSGVVLATVTGLLYSFSSAYFGGYLGTLGLDADVLDRNLHQVLYHGFVISFIKILTILFFYAMWRYFYSYIFLPSVNDKLKKSFSTKRSFIKFKHRFSFSGKRKDSQTESNEKVRAKFAIKNALVFIIVIILCATFEQEGKGKALEQMKLIENNQYSIKSNIFIEENDAKVELVFLACGSKYCAGFDIKEKLVRYFPLDKYFFSSIPSTVKK
jgi:hypothetical protein